MADRTKTTVSETSIATKLAHERTFLARDRTMMAWIRTATALISFGFTIYKFFELDKGRIVEPNTQQLLGPRHFAMGMITIGLVALALATIQHWQQASRLRKQHIEVPRSLATVVALFISLFGIMAMVAVIFRM
jgi:putative membrane protein